MCRILILNPGATRKQALDILGNMLGDNKDGTGECYVKDGKFVLNKYVQPLDKVIKKGKVFLDHLPHNGFTIIHIRRASVGLVEKSNSQPFVSLNKEIAAIHNGTCYGTGLLSLYLSTCLGYEGDSDSRAITEILSRVGVRNFAEYQDFGGTFAVLNLDGSIEIAKLSRELSLHYTEDGSCIISSEFDESKYKSIELANGYYKFDAQGRYVTHKVKGFRWSGYEKTVVSAQGWNGVHYQAPNAYQSNLPTVYGGQDNKRDQEMLGECWGC